MSEQLAQEATGPEARLQSKGGPYIAADWWLVRPTTNAAGDDEVYMYVRLLAFGIAGAAGKLQRPKVRKDQTTLHVC